MCFKMLESVIMFNKLCCYVSSTETAFREKYEDSELPNIPVQPIGYGDAIHILRYGGKKIVFQKVAKEMAKTNSTSK